MKQSAATIPVRDGFLSDRKADVAQRAVNVFVPVGVVVAVQIILFPVPPGVWLQGLVLGLLDALMAVGLAMVYRSNQIVNFAQGDLGSAPAVLAYGLIGFSGVNYFLGLATGLVAVVLLTVALEILIVRRFARFPRLVLTVATIGLSQALSVLSLVVADIWGTRPIATASVHFPWHLSLGLSPVVLSADEFVGAAVAVAALVCVALWFRFTELGIASRASGDHRDRAAMLGIPVNRLQTLTWAVAGMLSFLSVFLRAAIVGLPLDATFGLTALVGALGALALGGFTDLPAVALAAVAIGILEQGVAWDQPSSPTLVLAVIAAVVMTGVFFRQMAWRAGPRQGASQWTLASGVRDLPANLRRLVEVRIGSATGAVALVALLVTLPLWLGPGNLLEVSTLLVLAVVGCSLVVLTGWAGQVSLGQMSFAAVGAVAGAAAMADWRWDLSLALLFAGSVAALTAFVVAIPTLRLEGAFVAVTTLAFGLAASGFLLARAEFSWIPTGVLRSPAVFGVRIASQEAVFYTCLAVAVLVALAMHGMRRSRFGRVLRAVSTNDRAASGYGISPHRSRLMAFAVSGFIAGLAGCLLVLVNQQYVESSFTETASLAVFTATAVGGLGSVLGAVVGAALVEGSAVFLPPSWQLFPSAFGVVLVLLAFPGGLASLIFGVRDRLVGWLAQRHGYGVATDAVSSPPANLPVLERTAVAQGAPVEVS
jgi:ABC-type branched-subunit amino acid transport system permease subunit